MNFLTAYEYKYNAFYDTEYEFDNPYEVADIFRKWSTNRKEFTYTYDER